MRSHSPPSFITALALTIPRMRVRRLHKTTVMQTPQLVTWDIDGTLLAASGKSGNAAHKRAIDEAVNHVHSITTKVNDVPHAGCTDIGIVRSMCRLGNIPDDVIDKSMPLVLDDAAERIARYVDSDLSHLVLPGVREALDALHRRGVPMALTTGNLESAAWAKVGAAGLKQFFVGGAFGSDCEHRSDILRTAIQRVGNGVDVTRVVHVGDAIADVRAAREVGAAGIGVLTGSFERHQLEEESPLAVLDDLSDTPRFLETLGFKQ